MSNYKKIAEIANDLDNKGYVKEAEFITALLEKRLNKVVAQLHQNSDHMDGIEVLKEPLEVHYVEHPEEDAEESNSKFAYYLNTGRTITAQYNDNYPEGGTWRDRVDEYPNGPSEDDDDWMQFLSETGNSPEDDDYLDSDVDEDYLDPEELEFQDKLNNIKKESV